MHHNKRCLVLKFHGYWKNRSKVCSSGCFGVVNHVLLMLIHACSCMYKESWMHRKFEYFLTIDVVLVSGACTILAQIPYYAFNWGETCPNTGTEHNIFVVNSLDISQLLPKNLYSFDERALHKCQHWTDHLMPMRFFPPFKIHMVLGQELQQHPH